MSYIFSAPVDNISFEKVVKMLDWAKTHCASYITVDATKIENQLWYQFYFSEESDLVCFKLVWS